MRRSKIKKLFSYTLYGVISLCLIISATSTSTHPITKTIIVDQEGAGDYTTITAAIKSANNGDTILVHKGIYQETGIVINKTIDLLGEEINSTIIQGDGTKTILIIKAEDVFVTDFTIANGGDWKGANIQIFSKNCTVSHTIIQESEGAGISIHNSSKTVIKQNTFKNNQDGIMCFNCITSLISNNLISDSIAGIYLYNSNNMVIEQNIVSTCSKGIYLEESDENTIQRNQISLNEQGLFASYSDSNLITENNYISNTEQAKFTTWLSPSGLQISSWDKNYWEDSLGSFPKWIPGVLFIRTFNPIGIFLPWGSFDWHPALEPYSI